MPKTGPFFILPIHIKVHPTPLRVGLPYYVNGSDQYLGTDKNLAHASLLEQLLAGSSNNEGIGMRYFLLIIALLATAGNTWAQNQVNGFGGLLWGQDSDQLEEMQKVWKSNVKFPVAGEVDVYNANNVDFLGVRGQMLYGFVDDKFSFGSFSTLVGYEVDSIDIVYVLKKLIEKYGSPQCKNDGVVVVYTSIEDIMARIRPGADQFLDWTTSTASIWLTLRSRTSPFSPFHIRYLTPPIITELETFSKSGSQY